MRAKTHRLFLHFLLLCRKALHKVLHICAVILRRARRYLKRLTPLHIAAALFGGVVLFVLLYGLAFLFPRNITFAYDKPTCFANPIFLPKLITKKTGATYKATPVTKFAIGGYPIYSHDTCIRANKPPTENSKETVRFGTGLLHKRLTIVTQQFPSLNNKAVLDRAVPTQDPLTIELTTADNVFDYRLHANDKTVTCTKQQKEMACDVGQLGLAQSAKYDFKLQRFFREVALDNVFEHNMTTVESVHVTGTSITPNQVVYDTRDQFNLALNRPVTAMEGAHLYIITGNTRQEVPITTTLSEATITVKAQQPLARSATFVFSVDRITAADGGFLASPFSLPFTTSGGPKVARVSIGSYRVSPASNVVLTFDSTLAANQALQNFVRLEAGGAAVAARISANNNTVTITPDSPLPRCAPLVVKVLDGLQNSYGISGGSAWQYRSRVICQSAFSIGSSVQGRGITAYSFGSGPSRMVFVGGTHGDEKSSVYLLNRWVDELEASGNIPAQRTIVIIPSLNPDGFALNRRTNANNVDLNRNFPSNNWKSGVTMPDQSFNPTGGGTAPLSEPESRAFANYALGARLVLTYHAVAGVVIPNDAGDSVGLAHAYDQKSNVGFLANGQSGTVFHYDTTGAMEDWLYDKPGIPSLLVELWTKADNEFAKHQSALWSMIQIP